MRLVLHLRHADGRRRRNRGSDQETRHWRSEAADRGSRIQGRADRRPRRARPAGEPCPWLIAADLLKKLRFNVQFASSDWGTVVTRRPCKSRSRKVAGTSLAPISLAPRCCTPGLIRRSRPTATGLGRLAQDDGIDALRKAWLNKLNAGDSEVRQEIAAEIQERAFETVPCIPTGQYLPQTAYRKTCTASSRRWPCLCGTSRKFSSIVCDVA